MTRKLWILCLVLCLALLVACAQQAAPSPKPSPVAEKSVVPKTSAPATSAAPAPSALSFAGKTITIVTTTSPGGGSDVVARFYTRFLPKFLPGNPTMIVRNMPGGNYTVGGNYVYQLKPDGLTILITSGGMQIAYITKAGGVKFDLQKMPAMVANTSGALYVAKPGLVSKIEDLPKNTDIVFGAGMGSAPAYLFVCIVKLLDVKPKKMVLGYSGGGDARRAYLAGEINVTGGSTDTYSVDMEPYIKKGESAPLFQSGILDDKGNLIRDPGLQLDLATVKEVYEKIYGKAPSGIAWEAYMGLIAASRAYQNVLVMPPGTPDSTMRVYWDATERMIKDADYKKAAVTAVGDTPWLAGPGLAEGFKKNLVMEQKALEWFRATMAEFGYVMD